VTKAFISLGLSGLCLLCAPIGMAQTTPAQQKAAASLGIVQPLSIKIVSQLSFGHIALLPAVRSASITIHADPALSPTTQGLAKGTYDKTADDDAKPAKHLLSGEPGKTYRIIIPKDLKSYPGGRPASKVTIYSALRGDISRSRTGQFDDKGEDILTIGATLTFKGTTPPGRYTAPVSLTIAYE
jgi:hypothetical protein